MSDAPGPPPWRLSLASAPLLLFVALPLVVLIVFSPPAEVLRHLATPMALHALRLSIQTTLFSTAIVVVLGTPVAYLLARHRFRGRAIVDALLDLPVTLPPVVAGLGLLLAFGRRGLIGRNLEWMGLSIAFTSVAVILAQVFIASPFFVKAARAGFETVDRRLEDAARSLGAGPWRVFWSVTAPLARPALASGIVLAWARALSEFGATIVFAGNMPGRTQTLTLAVMTALESDLETAVAVSVLSLVLALVALLAGRALAAGWSAPRA